MIEQIIDKVLFVLGAVLFISDLLYPVWLIGIIIYLKRKKWATWKAWGVASTFCLGQAYFVAKFIGWNIGAYTLIGVGLSVTSFIYDFPPHTPIDSYITPFQSFLSFWIIPPVTLIIIPMVIIFCISKLLHSINQHDNEDLKIQKNV